MFTWFKRLFRQRPLSGYRVLIYRPGKPTEDAGTFATNDPQQAIDTVQHSLMLQMFRSVQPTTECYTLEAEPVYARLES